MSHKLAQRKFRGQLCQRRSSLVLLLLGLPVCLAALVHHLQQVSAGAAISYSLKNHRMSSDDVLEKRSDDQPTSMAAAAAEASNSTSSSLIGGANQADIVISSLEEEPAFGQKIGGADKRHHYDQQQQQQQQQLQLQPAVLSGPEIVLGLDQVSSTPASVPGSLQIGERDENQKHQQQQQLIEPRNEQADGAQQLTEQQQQLANEIIIDHRPPTSSEMAVSEQHYSSSTQTPPLSSSTTPSYLSASPSSSSSTVSSTSQGPAQSGPFNGQQLVVQTPNQYPTQWMQTNVQNNANNNQPQVIYARQAQPQSTSSNQQQQQQQFGNMMSGSNQVVSTIQHPTSINSIISEQQQQSAANNQQQQQQQIQMQQPTGQQMLANGQLVMVGPQQQLQLPNGMAASGINQQVVGMTANGRRMSISNWLRGLGSMLANIFNRRDHNGLATNGLTNGQLQASGINMVASGSSPSGHWIQLGPNAPHWLTQAQSAIQQFQQQTQQITLPAANRLSAFIQGTTPQQQQQQQAGMLGSMPSTGTIAIAMPQQQQQQVGVANYQQQPQQQQQQQQLGDLQASGSSQSYITIQTPTGASVATGASQPYQAAAASNGQTHTILVGQLQQPQQAGNTAQQVQVQPQQQQQVTSHQLVAPQQQQQLQNIVKTSSIEQLKQVPTSQTSPQAAAQPSSVGQARFGRGASQPKATTPLAASAAVAQQTTNGNLPLAHYSQYSNAD